MSIRIGNPANVTNTLFSLCSHLMQFVSDGLKYLFMFQAGCKKIYTYSSGASFFIQCDSIEICVKSILV